VRFDAPEVRVQVTLDGAEEALPRALDLGGMAGARVVLHRAFALREVHTTVACVVAPTTFWVPGLEATVLDAASAKVRAGASLATLTPGQVRDGRPMEQGFTGAGPGLRASGRHVLGFVGDEADLLVCSAVCVEPEGDGSARSGCDGAAAASTVEAAFVGAPSPGPLLRLALAAADSPRGAVAVGLVAGALVIVALLRARPRPGRTH